MTAASRRDIDALLVKGWHVLRGSMRDTRQTSRIGIITKDEEQEEKPTLRGAHGAHIIYPRVLVGAHGVTAV